MGKGGPIVDFPLLAAAASHFSSYVGVPTDNAAQQFLDSYPLPIIFSALERGSDVPGLESAVTSCLEKIFSTSYGRSLLPQAVPYAVVGFSASSSLTRKLTCFAIGKLLENSEIDGGAGIQALAESDAIGPLIYAVADGDSSVASAAAAAVTNLASSPKGLELIFSERGGGVNHLKQMVSHESALIRIRALAIAAKIFGLSEPAARAIQQAGLLKSLEDELGNSSDLLAQLNALELLAEVSETQSGARFLMTGHLIGHLASTIENTEADSLVRCRAMIVGARLLSSYHSVSSPITDEDANIIVVAIDKHLDRLKSNENDSAHSLSSEQEVALDSLGQIGISARGAELLLCGSPPIARHVIEAAFRQHGGGTQLAAVHALASIAGTERTEMSPLLNEQAEISLHNLIYTFAAGASGRTPADLLWMLIKQAPDIKMAAYRLVVALAARSWTLWEICSHEELVNTIADPHSETEKAAMDWRHSCCVALATALETGSQRGEQFPPSVVTKIEASAKRGPYLITERREATPMVGTMDRF